MRRDDTVETAAPKNGHAVWISVLALALTIGVALADYLSGAQIALSFFYLAPILLITWKLGRTAGLFIAVISAAAYPLSDILAGGRFEAEWIPLWNFVVRSGTFMTIVFLTTSLHQALSRERDLSRLDALTGLSNSRWFMDRAQVELDQARAAKDPVTVVYMDLDNFKSVNDDFGHAAGDDLLREVGRILKGSTRDHDLLARLGGDEFGLLLPAVDGDQAAVIVDRIMAALTEHALMGGLPVSFSVGQVTSLSAEQTVDELLWFADHLMYSAKGSGKATSRRRTLGRDEHRAVDVTEGAPVMSGGGSL